jgi:hypothetical protein
LIFTAYFNSKGISVEILVSGGFDLPEEIWRKVKEISEPEPDALVKQDLMVIKTTFGEEKFSSFRGGSVSH